LFLAQADICQLGMDQRKVNMLAREYCEFPDIKKKRKFKPIILSHHMLMGLKQGQAKMSKSDPESAIFMEDEAVCVSQCAPVISFQLSCLYQIAGRRCSQNWKRFLSSRCLGRQSLR
jgi:hypothetical protein